MEKEYLTYNDEKSVKNFTNSIRKMLAFNPANRPKMSKIFLNWAHFDELNNFNLDESLK